MIKLVVCSGLQDREPLSETSSVAFVPQPCFPIQGLVWASSTIKGEKKQQAVSFGRKYSYFNGYDVMNY